MDTISLHTCRELLIKTNNSNFILLLIFLILKCFNAKYYKIFEDDFEYKDGKYFPKIN